MSRFNVDSIEIPKVNLSGASKLAVPLIAIIMAIVLWSSLVSTVEKGTYQIKQAAVTGDMSAQMTPGMYGLFFGTPQTWPKAETYYFTGGGAGGDNQGDTPDACMGVQFNEGSTGKICGTVRVRMPSSGTQAISLITEQGYLSFEDLENKLIMPVVHNSLRLTANLMSARQSYAEQRSDFISWTWDQIQNGMYQTYDVVRQVVDPVSGAKINKTFKEIKKDANGLPARMKNPLEGTGIILDNFNVKSFDYSAKVKAQIATQQDAFMAVSTGQAKAAQAEQDAIRAEAQGKAKVMTAKYEMEQQKIKAVVQAQKAKEVATLKAQQDLEVAKLAKQAAIFTKQEQILLGQGEAERKKLVMGADGALKQKLDAWLAAQKIYAESFGKQKWVPEIQFGNAGGGTGDAVSQFMSLLSAKAATDLGLDMSMKRQAQPHR